MCLPSINEAVAIMTIIFAVDVAVVVVFIIISNLMLMINFGVSLSQQRSTELYFPSF